MTDMWIDREECGPGEVHEVTLDYPDITSPTCQVELSINHVRAIESIRVTFDGEANEWIVLGIEEHGECDVDDRWVEVARVSANGVEKE